MSSPVSSPVTLEEQIEIFLGCDDLISEDFFGKGDPFIVLYMKNEFSPQFNEIGRTEVIYNTGNPRFATRFTLNYSFNANAMLRFDVYDCDKDNSKRLSDHDFIGTCTVFLSEILRAKDKTLRCNLKKNNNDIKNSKLKKNSTLSITSEARCGNDEIITLQFAAQGLPSMNGILIKKGSDPCFDIYRTSHNDEEKICVKEKCDPIKNELNPTWPAFNISFQRLCNSDPNKQIEIHVWDWDSPKKYNFIGKWKTTFNELKEKKTGMLVDNNGKKEGKLGTIQCIKFETKTVQKEPTFVDYLNHCEISLIFGIDFTASNGDPKDPKSLHYIDIETNKLNSYQTAIRLVGNIVSKYDSDDLYPVYGFGAKLPNTEVLHDFALNFNEESPYIKSISGIEEAYINALKSNKLQFFENKLFCPILQKSISMAKKAHLTNKENLQYLILVIITNTCLDDFRQAKDLIVEAANQFLPLSIIIIGVGDSHFPSLLELEGKYHPLKDSNNISAKRNIVRFVALNEVTTHKELTHETLKDIPNQFLGYVKYHKISSNPTKKDDDVKANDHQNVIQRENTKYPNNNNNNKNNNHDNNNNNNNNNNDNNNNSNNNKNNGNDKEECDDDDIDYEKMPLPQGWSKSVDQDGNVFYINHIKRTTQWEHPLAAQQNFSKRNN